MLQVNSKKGALSSQENLIKGLFSENIHSECIILFGLREKKLEQFFNLIVVTTEFYIHLPVLQIFSIRLYKKMHTNQRSPLRNLSNGYDKNNLLGTEVLMDL